MSFIRTVWGDVAADELGVCYAHEHVVIGRSHTTEKNPDFLIEDVDRIVAELGDFRAAGGRAMVDSMPGGGAGRDINRLTAVSRRSGVHIVAPTGLHLEKYYPAGHWGGRLDEGELAEVFIGEIEEGIDENDLAGPVLRRSGHRAGVTKVAGGLDRLDDRERRIFRAAVAAQRATGAPILTHTEQGTAALEQIDILRDAGAELRHVVLSHTDRRPDTGYHRKILSSGVRVEFDSAFRWKQGNPTLELVMALAGEFGGQILLGMDAARASYWRSFGGGPGLGYLLTTFAPMLREAGLTREAVDRIFITNPSDAYAFSAGSA